MKLSGVALVAVALAASSAYAANKSGTWYGKGSDGKWYSGPWKLQGNKMYFNGRDSACRGKAITTKVTGSTLTARGCGTTWNCTSSGKKYSCKRNRFGNPYIMLR